MVSDILSRTMHIPTTEYKDVTVIRYEYLLNDHNIGHTFTYFEQYELSPSTLYLVPAIAHSIFEIITFEILIPLRLLIIGNYVHAIKKNSFPPLFIYYFLNCYLIAIICLLVNNMLINKKK